MTDDPVNARSVAVRGLADGLGLPWIIVMTSMMGFGSLAVDAGLVAGVGAFVALTMIA